MLWSNVSYSEINRLGCIVSHFEYSCIRHFAISLTYNLKPSVDWIGCVMDIADISWYAMFLEHNFNFTSNSKMSFVSSKLCPFASNLWPSTVGGLIVRRNRKSTGDQTDTIPKDLEGLLAWASVERDPMYDEIPIALCLAYKETLPEIRPISIHLYGFLEEFSLRTFGNWNG